MHRHNSTHTHTHVCMHTHTKNTTCTLVHLYYQRVRLWAVTGRRMGQERRLDEYHLVSNLTGRMSRRSMVCSGAFSTLNDPTNERNEALDRRIWQLSSRCCSVLCCSTVHICGSRWWGIIVDSDIRVIQLRCAASASSLVTCAVWARSRAPFMNTTTRSATRHRQVVRMTGQEWQLEVILL